MNADERDRLVNAALSRHSGSILAREVDRLRAELADAQRVGDALADDADRVQYQYPPSGPDLRELESSTQRWRAVRGAQS